MKNDTAGYVTLILLIANANQVVQISDRRLSGDSLYCTDEGAKIGTLLCGDARLAFSFTGLAIASTYVTLDWLMDKILDCASPDYSIEGIVLRLSKLLDREFTSNSNILSIKPEMRRLSIVLAGYTYTSPSASLLTAVLLSNYTYLAPSTDGSSLIQIDSPVAEKTFRALYFRPTDPAKPATLVARIGAWQATTDGDMASLGALLAAKKPAHAMVGKAVKTIRAIADRRSARGLIGKQLNSIVIPQALEQSVQVQYHSAVNTNRMYWPANIDARLGSRGALDIWIELESSDAGPWIVPQVRRDYPCPCKSGKRYKYCHGKHMIQQFEIKRIRDSSEEGAP